MTIKNIKDISELLDKISNQNPTIYMSAWLAVKKNLNDYEVSVCYKDGRAMVCRIGKTAEEALDKVLEYFKD